MKKDWAIINLAAAQTLVWAGLFYIFPALLLRWERELGWSKADLTAGVTLAIFISAITSPFAGRLIDAGKGAWMMAGSSFIGGLSLIGLSMVTELHYFYIVWGFIGVILAGCLYDPCFALITRARGARAKQGIIFVTLIAGFAGTISFPTAHSFAEAFGWRAAVQFFACVVILLATPLMWLGARQMERSGARVEVEKITQHHQQRGFIASPIFWFLALGFALTAVCHGVILHHLLSILDDREIHPEVAVTAAAFIGPMQVAGRLAMMAVERYVSNHAIATACFTVMMGAVLLLMGAAVTPALLVGFVILFGAGYGTVSIIRPLIARDILGDTNFGAKTGALALVYLIGSGSAPFLGSLVWALGGYGLVLSALLGVTLLGLILYLFAHSYSRRTT